MKGYRTLTVNLLAGAIPVLSLTEITEVLPLEWLPWYALGLALLNVALRMITTTPIGKS